MREVVESERFSRERNGIVHDTERWDDMFVGLEWALSNKPEFGQATGAEGIYAIPVWPWRGMIDLVVYYEFDEGRVTLLSIIRAMPDPNDEEE